LASYWEHGNETFGLLKSGGIYLLIERLAASQEELFSLDYINK
jgi:hypothetical protein